jgi:hypothetical protein
MAPPAERPVTRNEHSNLSHAGRASPQPVLQTQLTPSEPGSSVPSQAILLETICAILGTLILLLI